jgi:hypothetical protein
MNGIVILGNRSSRIVITTYINYITVLVAPWGGVVILSNPRGVIKAIKSRLRISNMS